MFLSPFFDRLLVLRDRGSAEPPVPAYESSEPQLSQPSSIDSVPPQTGHSAARPAARASQASSTTSSSVTPRGSNSLKRELSPRGLSARAVPVALSVATALI